MEQKICTQRNIEKSIADFYHKIYTECRICNVKRGLKGYYENKDKLSTQRKIYHEKKRNFYKNYIDPMLNYKIE